MAATAADRHLLLPILTILTTLSLPSPATATFWNRPTTTTPTPNAIKLGPEKLSHFQFYWHDTQSTQNPTSITIIKPPPSSTGFGTVNMIDDPLTDKPDNGSQILGRAQGFYGLSSQEEIGLIMVMNFVFVTGRYSGSTLTVVGRNAVAQKVREMPVIGGTGLFRFARGYVQASTHSLNVVTRDAIVKYNVYVLHY